MEDLKKKFMKPKYIVAALALIGGVYVYHSFSKEALKESAKETAIDLAKDAGKYAVNKAKEKWQERKEGGAVLSEGTPDVQAPAGTTLDDLVNGTAAVQKTQIKSVDHSEFLSIDDVSVTPEQANIMFMNAVKSNDLPRIKHLAASGVKIDFTDDKVCARNPYGGNEFAFGDHGYSQHEMPKDVMSMKKIMKYVDPTYMFTNDCKNLFLLASIYGLERETSEAEFDIFYGKEALNEEWKRNMYSFMQEWGIKDVHGSRAAFINGEGQFKPLKEKFFADKKAEIIEVQKQKREVFELLLSMTPKKDYYQFVHAIGDPKVPQDVRIKLANLYIQNIDSIPVSAGRKEFVKVFEDAAVQLLQESPANEEWRSIAVAFKAPLYNSFTLAVDELISNLADSIAKEDSYLSMYASEKSQRPSLPPVTLPELSVKTTASGRYDPYIKGVNEEIIRFADPKMHTNYQNFYSSEKFYNIHLANRELEIVRLLMASGKVNPNLQDANGQSILHRIVHKAGGSGRAVDRAAAIVIRHLLNSGVNPNLLDKKGASAHASLIAKEDESNRRYGRVVDGYREMKNAFTLKTYN